MSFRGEAEESLRECNKKAVEILRRAKNARNDKTNVAACSAKNLRKISKKLSVYAKGIEIGRRAWYNLYMERPPMLRIPIIALSLDGGGALAFLLGLGFMHGTHLFMLSILFYLATVILPIAGIAVGIGALCLPKKDIGRSGFIMAITAIVIPVLVVVILVILFSTGVARITLM